MQILPPEAGNATIVELFPNQSAALLDGADKASLCGYRMATLAARGAERERSPVCVGDRVLVQENVIVHRCERRNSLVRRAPNARNPLRHAVVANIDLLVVVASTRDPDFTPGIVDRFMAAATAQAIPTLLCVNKADLLEPGEAPPWAAYPAVVTCSAREGAGVEELARRLLGKTTAFCGHSGVGKTSLLRRLLGDDGYGRVGAISQASGKGRHTTTGAILLQGPGGSRFIDTPGIMNFEAA